MRIHNIKVAVAVVIAAFFSLSSCTKDTPMFLNKDSDLAKIQTKIEKLASSQQIDSVSIRSTEKKSLVSSIFVISTDTKKDNEYKNSVEFLPQQELTLNEKSKFKKDALHSYKINIPNLKQHIEASKDILPEGYTYRDVKSIQYNANPFGEKYYFSLEVSVVGKYEDNEYIEVYYDKQQATSNMKEATEQQINNMSNVYFIANFTVENETLEMVKAVK